MTLPREKLLEIAQVEKAWVVDLLKYELKSQRVKMWEARRAYCSATQGMISERISEIKALLQEIEH